MKNIAVKLYKAQAEIGAVTKDAVNPFYSSNYIEINSLLKAVTPILSKHGVLLMQPLSNVDGKTSLTTILIDVDSGESIETTTMVPEVSDPQKMGSAITYFRRYALLSALGLGAQDDDANSSSPSAKPKKAKPTGPKAVRKAPAASF